jgi:Protein of unknown function (DUF2281)
MVQPIILDKLEELSESLQVKVLHYIEFLLDQQTKTTLRPQQESIEENPENLYGYGILAGKIIMSDDFDQPLDDLKEYM